MPQRDRTTANIDLIEAARYRDLLRREGLIALDHIELVLRHASLLQRQLGGRNRAFAHDLIKHACDRARY